MPRYASFSTIPNPLTVTHSPLKREKMLVIANSSVSWSRSLCEYYCEARGIPSENILELALGTLNYAQVPSRDVYTHIYLPVLARVEALQAQAVLLGPGTQMRVEMNLYAFTAGSYVLQGTYGYAAICAIVESCRQLAADGLNNTTSILGSLTSNSGGWTVQRLVNLTTGFPVPSMSQAGWPAYIGSSSTWTDLFISNPFIDPDTGTNITNGGTAYVVTAQGTKETSESFPLLLATGKVGYTRGWDGTQMAETESYCRNLIDTATKWDRRNTISLVKNKRVIVPLSTVASWDINSQYSMVSYLRYIGLTNVKWYLSAYTAPTVAFDNVQDTALYPASAVMNNTMRDVEVAALFGDIGSDGATLNNTSAANDRINFYKPVEGACAALTPSYGHIWAINLLRRSGEACLSLVNVKHITAGFTERHLTYVLNLLSGLSGLEACYYTVFGAGYIYPIGDPLYRPFPHREEPLGETGTLRASWRKYLPTRKSFKG